MVAYKSNRNGKYLATWLLKTSKIPARKNSPKTFEVNNSIDV